MKKFLLSILFFSLSANALSEEFMGRVVGVMDGDTVLVVRNNGQQAPIKIRLALIDAPEKDQEFGLASRQSLVEILLNKEVRVTTQAVDDYGRLIAMIRTGDLNVNHEQIQRGWAWETSRFHSNKVLVAMQQEAQQNHRGLWAGSSPIAYCAQLMA